MFDAPQYIYKIKSDILLQRCTFSYFFKTW